MIKKPARILAIDPGTREMGIAVLEGENLLYIGVASMRKFPSREEQLRHAQATVRRFIRDFRPTVLALEKNFIGRNRSGSFLKFLVEGITALGQTHGLSIVALAANTIRKAVTGNGWSTKLEIARAIAEKFPKLMSYLPPDRKWKRAYRLNMFDAIAVGLAALITEIKNRSP